MNVPTHLERNSRNGGLDILLDVDAYLPWSGGSRTYYHHLYKRLARDYGLNVLVNTTHSPGDEEFDSVEVSRGLAIRRRGVRLTDWKAKRAPILASKAVGSAATAFSRHPMAIHCGDLFPQDFAGALLRRSTHLPFLVYVHGDEISQTQGRTLQPRLRDFIYRTADVVVAANEFARALLLRIVSSPDKVELITPGVDFSSIFPGPRPIEIRERWSLGENPVLMTVGRLTKKKGHETILRALPALRAEFPKLAYLVVGDGPERNCLTETAQSLGVADIVHFVGNVPNSQIGNYYRAADVVCMINQQDETGDIESFGMVFVEANAAGKPVVGGHSGGTDQAVVHGITGFLCEPGNHKQAVDFIGLLLRNSDLRRRMGESGFIRARKDFDWDTRASQLAAIHTRMMGNAGARHVERGICSLP